MNAANPNTTASLTLHVAEFIHNAHYSDIPASVIACSKKAILDTLGVALAGAKSDGSEIIQRHIAELDCASGGAAVYGTDARAPARFAALANGCAMHADDYDDTFHPSRVHPSAPVVAALFADAERDDRSGRDVLTAFNVGVEVTCKVSQAIDNEHYQRGYHATGTCGVFGAAAAVCNLRGLPLEATRFALGIAGSSSSGLRENFGTMVKPLHTGRAAENGWVAASLAASGFTAAPTILEGERGFFLAGGGRYDEKIIRNRMGAPWTFDSPGVGIKPFPSGALTHPAMSKMRDLVIEHNITPDQVARVGIKTNRLLPENLTYHRPVTGLQGKFSMEFCLASILVLRRAGLAEFTDAVAARADIQDAIAKFDYTTYSDDEAKTGQYTRLTSFIDIHLKSGKTVSARVDEAKGSAAIPMNEDDVAEKFRECAAFAGWSAERSEKIVKTVYNLENVAKISELTALLLRA